jgi:transcriptional regulator with XRE-family HTH domain
MGFPPAAVARSTLGLYHIWYTSGMRGGLIIRRARRRAGVTQSELASRLSTSQSLVARWERGTVEPPFETVVRAVRACGLDLSLGLSNYDDQHDVLIDWNLRLTPEGRLERMVASQSFAEELRAAGRRTSP